jgi:hypothetical protein
MSGALEPVVVPVLPVELLLEAPPPHPMIVAAHRSGRQSEAMRARREREITWNPLM